MNPATEHPAVGVQSVVFGDRSLEDCLAELESLGVDHLELLDEHRSPADDEATIEASLERIADAGVSVCGYGVVDLERPEDVEAHVAFADRLGADYLTVNYPPEADAITEALLEAAERYGLEVAIHNYSTVHHDDLETVFSSVADVRGMLERYPHPNLGVCVDTGHFLVMEESPEDVIRDLGDRIVAVHLKDTSAAEVEDLPGAGRLDLPSVLAALEAHAALEHPLVIEYELPADQASEALSEAIENVERARSR